MRAAIGAALGVRTAWRPVALVLVALVLAGLGPSSPARAQAFQPQPPTDVSGTRAEVCRPATPAVEKTPGRSVDISRGPADCNAVALTFDAGADRGYAEQILDILHQEQVPASFGMTGLWASQNPDLIQRMVEDGHEFINHTWDHRSFTGFSVG